MNFWGGGRSGPPTKIEWVSYLIYFSSLREQGKGKKVYLGVKTPVIISDNLGSELQCLLRVKEDLS